MNRDGTADTIRQAELPAVSEACTAIFRPTPGSAKTGSLILVDSGKRESLFLRPQYLAAAEETAERTKHLRNIYHLD